MVGTPAPGREHASKEARVAPALGKLACWPPAAAPRACLRKLVDLLRPSDRNDQYGCNGGINMITETSAVNFRQNLGEMLNHVQYRRDSVVINKDGKPVAVLIDAQLFERIRRMQDRFDALARRIEKGYSGIPEQDGLAEIDAAVQAERAQAPAANSKQR
jgi:prevent-host-death family protein